MAQRTIKVGDIAQITVQGHTYNFPITNIDSRGIHTPSYLIISKGNIWQVSEYTVPHTVTFSSGEPPVYAIYPREGPRKILLLLKPNSREVVYTPLGITFLKLDQQRLPSYELAANLVARGGSEYVALPYLKGRSETEVEQLISQQPIPEEYQIRDITPGAIYQGPYGKIERIERSLQQVAPCQEHQYFKLSNSPKGSPFYNRFIQQLDNFFPGQLIMGQGGDSLISSTLGFEDILDDLEKCGRVYYLIGVSKDKINVTQVASEETAHAMGITIDPQRRLIEVFDPNGISPDTQHVYYWVDQLVDFLQKNRITVHKRITADEPFCPQGVSAFAPEFKGEQQCLVWAYWYIWLRVNNPEISGEAIRRYMMRLTPSEAFDRIRRIASLAFGL
jgi:hypothetical protein